MFLSFCIRLNGRPIQRGVNDYSSHWPHVRRCRTLVDQSLMGRLLIGHYV